MTKKRTSAETIEEIIQFIRQNQGPDLEGSAHNEIRQIEYLDLRDALDVLHERGEVLGVKAYHFLSVQGIWKGEDGEGLARGAFGEFVAHTQRKGWTIDEMIEKGDKYLFDDEIPIPGSSVTYSIKNAVAQKYKNSFALAMLDFLRNNSDEEIRKRYQHIRPWHLGTAPAGTWKGKEGKANARAAFGEFVEYQKSKGSDIADLIERGDGFLLEEEIPVTGCDVTFSIKSMVAHVYQSSFVSAMMDWLQNNPNEGIRDGYADLRPFHFGRSTKNTWQGEQGKINAREITGNLIKTLQERYHWNLTECLERISQEHFAKEPIPLHLPGRTIYYTAAPILNSMKGSFKEYILDWINQNPDQKIREGYSFWRVWNFSKTQKEEWQGEQGKQNGREVTGKVVEHLQKKGWTIGNIIQGIRKREFQESLTQETPDGVLYYDGAGALQNVYNNSPSGAILDWIAYHPDKRIRNGYRKIRPWHFQKSQQRCWKGEQGKQNGREVTTEVVRHLKKKYGWTLKDIIENISYNHVKEELYVKTPECVIGYTPDQMVARVYVSSPVKAVLDWIAHHPDEKIRTGYAVVRPWHFKRAPSGTWQSQRNPEEAKKNGIEITDQLIKHVMKVRSTTEEQVLQSLQEYDFINEEMQVETHDGPIKYTAVGALQTFGSIKPAIAAWKEYYKRAG